MSKDVKIKQASIDRKVLNIMKNDEIMAVLNDDKLMKRFELNSYCEVLSTLGDIVVVVKRLADMVRVCGASKLKEFFETVNANYKKEETRAYVANKVEQGHKKSKKNTK